MYQPVLDAMQPPGGSCAKSVLMLQLSSDTPEALEFYVRQTVEIMSRDDIMGDGQGGCRFPIFRTAVIRQAWSLETPVRMCFYIPLHTALVTSKLPPQAPAFNVNRFFNALAAQLCQDQVQWRAEVEGRCLGGEADFPVGDFIRNKDRSYAKIYEVGSDAGGAVQDALEEGFRTLARGGLSRKHAINAVDRGAYIKGPKPTDEQRAKVRAKAAATGAAPPAEPRRLGDLQDGDSDADSDEEGDHDELRRVVEVDTDAATDDWGTPGSAQFLDIDMAAVVARMGPLGAQLAKPDGLDTGFFDLLDARAAWLSGHADRDGHVTLDGRRITFTIQAADGEFFVFVLALLKGLGDSRVSLKAGTIMWPPEARRPTTIQFAVRLVISCPQLARALTNVWRVPRGHKASQYTPEVCEAYREDIPAPQRLVRWLGDVHADGGFALVKSTSTKSKFDKSALITLTTETQTMAKMDKASVEDGVPGMVVYISPSVSTWSARISGMFKPMALFDAIGLAYDHINGLLDDSGELRYPIDRDRQQLIENRRNAATASTGLALHPVLTLGPKRKTVVIARRFFLEGNLAKAPSMLPPAVRVDTSHTELWTSDAAINSGGKVKAVPARRKLVFSIALDTEDPFNSMTPLRCIAMVLGHGATSEPASWRKEKFQEGGGDARVTDAVNAIRQMPLNNSYSEWAAYMGKRPHMVRLGLLLWSLSTDGNIWGLQTKKIEGPADAEWDLFHALMKHRVLVLDTLLEAIAIQAGPAFIQDLNKWLLGLPEVERQYLKAVKRGARAMAQQAGQDGDSYTMGAGTCDALMELLVRGGLDANLLAKLRVITKVGSDDHVSLRFQPGRKGQRLGLDIDKAGAWNFKFLKKPRTTKRIRLTNPVTLPSGALEMTTRWPTLGELANGTPFDTMRREMLVPLAFKEADENMAVLDRLYAGPRPDFERRGWLLDLNTNDQVLLRDPYTMQVFGAGTVVKPLVTIITADVVRVHVRITAVDMAKIGQCILCDEDDIGKVAQVQLLSPFLKQAPAGAAV
ncbi:hypothetical protein WJX72_002255 [[Myrmecia] bisecta]|uniref:Uncharacterized protein n=1 Tax=[Myrmecia] bisecta TaxID=41462 RepID=A0AAW1PN34_9CHLO